jgi:hypothetical protein
MLCVGKASREIQLVVWEESIVGEATTCALFELDAIVRDFATWMLLLSSAWQRSSDSRVVD